MACLAHHEHADPGYAAGLDKERAGHLRDSLMVSVKEERTVDTVRRTVSYAASDSTMTNGSIAYTFRGCVLPPLLESHDFAVLAVLFLAMSRGWDIHVRGSVSSTLLANLEEFQYAWRKWCPKAYSKISITADKETDSGPPGNGKAVLAFSGGVDATFSLLRNTAEGAGRQKLNIAAAVLIHGFDIPVDKQTCFEAVESSARRTLGEFGLPLTVIESDWKQTACTDWAMEYFVGVASCLYQFAGLMSSGLVGNCIDYQNMMHPWGSNPVTNPLLNSGGFRMITDGAGYTRREKMALIAGTPVLRDRLRVCWWGPLTSDTAGNCGRCEKCLRTKLGFLCHGIEPGLSLPPNHTCWDILLISVRTRVSSSEVDEILETARRIGIRAPWMAALQCSIMVGYVAVTLRRVYRPVKWAINPTSVSWGPFKERARRVFQRLSIGQEPQESLAATSVNRSSAGR